MTTRRLKHVLERNEGGCWGEDPIGSNDTVVLRSTEQTADGFWRIVDPAVRHISASDRKNKNINLNDIIITKSSGSADHIGKASIADHRVAELGAVYSNFMQRIRVSFQASPKYVWYLLNSFFARHHYNIYATSTSGLGNLSQSIVGNLPFPITDIETQRQIADFLDRETARIDLLIEKKQRLVALLSRKKEALRDTAVCKGIRVEADMKSSGVEWFGTVPAHWTVCRFNRLIASKVDYRGRTPEKVDDGVFLVTARNIRNGKIDYLRSQEYTTIEDWEKLSERGKPRIGDVIFTTEAPLGQIAQVDRTDVAFAQRIIKFRANDALISNDFLAEFMMTSSFQRSLLLYSSGSTAAGIKSERLAHLIGLAPPKSEQDLIVAFVRQEIEHLCVVEEPIHASIDRLKEYRSALITAAVTGQIDVKAAARSGATDSRLDALQEEMDA